MNRLLTFIFLLLITICSFGQNGNRNSEYLKLTETDSLYIIAIEKYIVEIDSFNNKYSRQKLPKTIYLEYQDYLIQIPDSINGYRIQKIGLDNRKNVFRKNKNELRLLKIFPLSIEDGKFKITLIPYFAELKRKNHLYLGLSDWTNVFFEYKNGHLIYNKTENGGI